MENYRTFFAIPLELDAGSLEAREKLIAGLEGERISWVKPANFHLTIRFIGDTDVSLCERIAEKLGDSVSSKRLGALQLAGPAYFGSPRKPRVITILLEKHDRLEILRNEMDAYLSGMGLELKPGEFRPHLTLGRIRSLKDPQRFSRLLDDFKTDFRAELAARQLVFFRSELMPGGARYTALKRLELAD